MRISLKMTLTTIGSCLLVVSLAFGLAWLAVFSTPSQSRPDPSQHPYSVIELSHPALGQSTFAYIDSDGIQRPFANCGGAELFAPFCQNSDNTISFHYGTYKSQIRDAYIIVGGQRHDLDCQSSLTSLSTCIPIN